MPASFELSEARGPRTCIHHVVLSTYVVETAGGNTAPFSEVLIYMAQKSAEIFPTLDLMGFKSGLERAVSESSMFDPIWKRKPCLAFHYFHGFLGKQHTEFLS